jgi:hypothetical protein
VVKGTTFTVTVGPEDARVKVTEGAVQVSTLDGGASDLLMPGSMAMVGKSDLYRLMVEGKDARNCAPMLRPPLGRATGRCSCRQGTRRRSYRQGIGRCGCRRGTRRDQLGLEG